MGNRKGNRTWHGELGSRKPGSGRKATRNTFELRPFLSEVSEIVAGIFDDACNGRPVVPRTTEPLHKAWAVRVVQRLVHAASQLEPIPSDRSLKSAIPRNIHKQTRAVFVDFIKNLLKEARTQAAVDEAFLAYFHVDFNKRLKRLRELFGPNVTYRRLSWPEDPMGDEFNAEYVDNLLAIRRVLENLLSMRCADTDEGRLSQELWTGICSLAQDYQIDPVQIKTHLTNPWAAAAMYWDAAVTESLSLSDTSDRLPKQNTTAPTMEPRNRVRVWTIYVLMVTEEYSQKEGVEFWNDHFRTYRYKHDGGAQFSRDRNILVNYLHGLGSGVDADAMCDRVSQTSEYLEVTAEHLARTLQEASDPDEKRELMESYLKLHQAIEKALHSLDNPPS